MGNVVALPCVLPLRGVRRDPQSTAKRKEREGKERRKEGKKEGRKGGKEGKEGKKEGRKERRKEKKEERKEKRKEERNERDGEYRFRSVKRTLGFAETPIFTIGHCI